jgi:hypothetical protein
METPQSKQNHGSSHIGARQHTINQQITWYRVFLVQLIVIHPLMKILAVMKPVGSLPNKEIPPLKHIPGQFNP